MRVTASQLRQDIFKILDQVIEKNETIEILRKGHLIRIVPEKKKEKLKNLKKRKYSDEPLSSFDHIDWTHEWKGGKK